METHKLNANVRERTGNQVGALRREGKVPAVVYANGIDSINLSLEGRELEKIYAEAGESSLVELSIDGQPPRMVVIKSVQHGPLRSDIIHVDLVEIKMGEKMDIYVEFEFVGESPAIKASGGMLGRSMDGVDVRCLPKDLVQNIQVDLGLLKSVGDVIHIKDLVVPEGFEILAEPDDVIATASAAEEAEEEEKVAAPADIESVQVVGKGGDKDKKEGSEKSA
ncbi:50S ribosomal protein L25 [Candidatus Uhrbacteria bacterium CG_4_10_14_0_8_um_filter_58_22]|uniref:Large ribosomal subunit protein bL25 n=1 Tax=Candidatus Uhrbacteria bacterium CG_4_10_14_0_8_um_filter_58_22 TaxID=1975029 RepID=A0A2M7QA87_9BACT|nr:MAG: hypothetical protein AUJ19_02105 [Parcubacteria group bacterium CG1_02_58_44]PIY62896.1 MAG: 50S ribosomal protein L25 [Candidatus Uhrbacteria bacterium CG_4_10_14_0_8_um_filter_58_22]